MLSGVLDEQGWSQHITTAFLLLPITAMLSPLFVAARADQVIAAEKLLAILVGGGTIFLWAAFETLARAESATLFLWLLGLNSLCTAPAWSLLNTVTLRALDDPARDFGKYRVWGTLGWMAAGWTVSLLAMDQSPEVGKLSIVARLLGAACCFMLPHTPPSGQAKNWKDVLGLGALRLFRQRNMLVFFGTSFLFSIPLAAFYPHTNLHLKELGFKSIAAGMTVGQMTEAVAMLAMGWLLRKWRIKWLLATAIGCGLIRYTCYIFGGMMDSPIMILIGVAFHGVCWAYYFEAGRVFLDRRVGADIKAQSQALLGLLTSGLGTVVGMSVVGAIHSHTVAENGEGWPTYWAILTGMCAVCLVGFILGYRKHED